MFQNRKSLFFFFSGAALIVSILALSYILLRGIFTPQTPLRPQAAGQENFHLGCGPSGTTGAVVKVNDKDASITYSSEWHYQNGGSGTEMNYQKDYHFFDRPRWDFAKNYTGASAEFTFTGNQFSVGTIGTESRGNLDIYLDDVLIDTYDTRGGLTVGKYAPISWNSPNFSCASHTIKVAQSNKPNYILGMQNRPSYFVVLDYISYTPCTTSANACVLLPGPGNDEDSCTSVGEQCGGDDATPPPPPSADDGRCQGNPNSSAKCFSCKKDDPNDQVNIFDFSCFSDWYGETVGKL